MKCKNCGAEISSGTVVCPYCQCEVEKEKQNLNITNNYYGGTTPASENGSSTATCPKCGSNKIKFKREEVGSTSSKKNNGQRSVQYRTVGICQECGNTWKANSDAVPAKKHGCLWWALVILFFPISIPLFVSKWFLNTDTIKLDKKIKWIIVGAFWLIYLIIAFASSGSSSSSDGDTAETTAVIEETTEEKETTAEKGENKKIETTVATTTEAATEATTEAKTEAATEAKTEAKTEATTEATTEAKPDVPIDYISALAKAKIYSDTMFMSKAAIYNQLTSEYGEKFSAEAAEWAMENLEVDYSENALKKAKTYSDSMYMSKAGIYDQLTSEYGEQFTADEAQYAVDNLEADYNKNALAKAKTYQQMSMSSEAIRDQLVSEYGEKFTAEEADYAITHLND